MKQLDYSYLILLSLYETVEIGFNRPGQWYLSDYEIARQCYYDLMCRNKNG